MNPSGCSLVGALACLVASCGGPWVAATDVSALATDGAAIYWITGAPSATTLWSASLGAGEPYKLARVADYVTRLGVGSDRARPLQSLQVAEGNGPFGGLATAGGKVYWADGAGIHRDDELN